ncbi:MAG: type II toxin-antitoxin system VapC family toxin [Bacteroidetes bacterium]|nr:type II toxin-antitoxin system VapC family toxin [Bacteroidota bacterium]
MAKKFLIDTNVLIDAQRKKLPRAGSLFLKQIIDKEFLISFVTYIEVLGYEDVTPSMEEFISLATVLEIDKSTINATISIRKNHNLKLPDAIIAATALVNNYTLVTRNISDFKRVKNLQTINPYKL